MSRHGTDAQKAAEDIWRPAASAAKRLDLPEVIHLPGPPHEPEPTAIKGAAKPPTTKRRSGSENRARPFVMFVRVTAGEHEEMEKAARAAGMEEIGTYARECALSEPEQRRGEPHTTTRPKSVAYRVTAEERERIEGLADAAGLTPGSYVRARALKRPVTLTTRRLPVQKAELLGELRRLLGLLGLAGSNINQLAREYNSGGEVSDEDLRPALTDVRAASQAIIRALSGRGE